MTNEEIQRTMEFILEQQAQFAASIQRAEEQRVRDTPRLTRLEESFQDLAELAKITDGRLDRLEDSYQVVVQLLQNSDKRLESLEDLRIHDRERVIMLEDLRIHDRERVIMLEDLRIYDHERVTRLEDSYQVLTQLAQKMDVRLEQLERPGG